MKAEAITKARSRLTRAKEAIAVLHTPEGQDRFEADWTDFLLASNTVYTVLEQGAKATPQSRQWFGRKKLERRRDPLLQYLHQARNADEHGLEATYDCTNQTLDVTFPPGHAPKTTTIKLDDGTEITADVPANSEGMLIEVRLFHLVTVRDSRYGTAYDPPAEHLGLPLEHGTNPLFVADLALDYLDALIDEAGKLVR